MPNINTPISQQMPVTFQTQAAKPLLKKQKTYPHFGERVESQCRQILNRKVAAVALVVFAIAVAVPIAALAFALPVIPLCIGAATLAITLLAAAALHHVITAKKKPYEVSSNSPVESSAPKLGKYSHNDVIISHKVDETFEWKKTLIQSAKKSLEISPNYAGGAAFREVLGLIDQQMTAERELKTHILVNSDLLEQQDIEILDTLQKTYPARFHFVISKMSESIAFDWNRGIHTQENHVKMILVDGKYFVTGGSGIHDKMVRENLPEEEQNTQEAFGAKFIDKTFRDTDVIGKGEVVPLMREQFFRLYRIMENKMNKHDQDRFFTTDGTETTCETLDTHTELFENVKMKFIVTGPECATENPITATISNRIAKSQHSIHIASLLFNPDDKIKKMLFLKKRENVNITGIFNGTSKTASSGHFIYTWPNRTNYCYLNEAYEYNEPDRLYHKKVLTFDDSHAMIGTFNLGQKSAYCDYECALFFKNRNVTAHINAALEEDKNALHTKIYSGKEVKKISRNVFQQARGKMACLTLGNFFG